MCVWENPRWRSHPYDGGGWGLSLDRKNWLERRGFWFECREMSLRSNHHRWWRWWSKEEPRRLGHGSLENRRNGSSVQANFSHLERSPPRFSLIMGVALLIRCCFSGFVASTLGCFVCFCCIFFGLLRKRELYVALFFTELEFLRLEVHVNNNPPQFCQRIELEFLRLELL